jgi:hypothetical protein
VSGNVASLIRGRDAKWRSADGSLLWPFIGQRLESSAAPVAVANLGGWRIVLLRAGRAAISAGGLPSPIRTPRTELKAK